MIWRGGLIVIPILVVYLLVKEPSLLIHRVLPTLFVFVPAAGFLGGLLYGATGPLLRPLGGFGTVVRFILGTWVYCILLIFVIIPLLDPTEHTSWASSGDWALSAGMGVVFGSVMGIQAVLDNSKTGTPDDKP